MFQWSFTSLLSTRVQKTATWSPLLLHSLGSRPWCPMLHWQSAAIVIDPVPCWWECVCLSGAIPWCHQFIPCLVFLAYLSQPSSRTPQPSPIGCYPSCRCGRIALVSCPRSAEQHFFRFQVVVAANVYEVFSYSTSFQMPAVNLRLFSLASISRMHIVTITLTFAP